MCCPLPLRCWRAAQSSSGSPAWPSGKDVPGSCGQGDARGDRHRVGSDRCGLADGAGHGHPSRDLDHRPVPVLRWRDLTRRSGRQRSRMRVGWTWTQRTPWPNGIRSDSPASPRVLASPSGRAPASRSRSSLRSTPQTPAPCPVPPSWRRRPWLRGALRCRTTSSYPP